MNPEEARAIMKTHRWTYQERKPRKKAKYVYAKRQQGKTFIERYICPLSRLGELTEEQLIAKLTQQPPAENL
jgi:hypothetical protein